MPRYYNFDTYGIHVRAKAPNIWRKLLPFPYLTGDPIAVDVIVIGSFNRPVENITFRIEYNGVIVGLTDPFPIQARYKPRFTRISAEGEYEIIMMIKLKPKNPTNAQEAFAYAIGAPEREKVATVHMQANWRPLTAIFIIILTTLISVSGAFGCILNAPLPRVGSLGIYEL